MIPDHFVRMLGVRLGYSYFGPPVAEVERMFGPQLRRTINDLMFMFKIVNGFIDCPGKTLTSLFQGVHVPDQFTRDVSDLLTTAVSLDFSEVTMRWHLEWISSMAPLYLSEEASVVRRLWFLLQLD